MLQGSQLYRADATSGAAPALAITAASSLTDLLGLSSSTAIDGDVAGNVFVSASGSTPATDTASLNKMVNFVTQAITAMSSVSADPAANTNNISSLNTYSNNLSDSLTAGVGALTDADMAAGSAKLMSLQTKQSLAIFSLSIAKSSSQNILTLFR